MKLEDKNLLRFCSYINGDWHAAETTFSVVDPATNEPIGSVAEINAEQLQYAIESAKKAQGLWADFTAKQRAVILRRWYQLIMENQQDLARLMTWEQGKPLRESMGEIANAASYIEWFAEQGKRVYGDIIPEPAADRRLLTIKQPVAVVSAITPWNFPTGMITRKAAPALSAGCSFIVKPSEYTPFSALALAELAGRAGIPAGVFNVITGRNAQEIGKVLTSHPLIRKFTFTGSTAVGKKLLSQCSSTVKKTSLELGGNAPLIVFDDADLDKAILGTMKSKFRNAGQTCVCANRIMVQRGIYERFVEALCEKITGLKVGNGFSESTDIGPLINTAAVTKVNTLVQEAIGEGARLVTGGKIDQAGNQFYQPTLLVDVSTSMRIARDEIFGPVAAIIPFDTEAEAIAMANDTPYGLASYFFTRDMGRIWRVSEALEYGIVGVNEGILTSVQAPFGGIKESGMGREGSRFGLDDYMEKKYLCMGGI